MVRNWKCLAVVTVLVLIFMSFPTTVFASSTVTTNAVVKGFTADNTALTTGQSTTVQVLTNKAARFVFAMVDGVKVYGINLGSDSAGDINWSITITPWSTQNVKVYVNDTDATFGAVVMSVQVHVNSTSGGNNSGSASGDRGVVINNIVETRGSVAGTAVLTVETNSSAKDVWVQFDSDKYVKGQLARDNGSVKTWTITFRPSRAQMVTVSANTSYVVTGAATLNFNVTLPAGSGNNSSTNAKASISNLRASKSTLIYGESTTLTVTTNLNTEYVWVVVDNYSVYAKLDRKSNSAKTWTVTIMPENSQKLTVYANSIESVTGAVNRTHDVTVNNRRTGNASIINAPSVTYSGSQANITVETNNHTDYVWVVYEGTTLTISSNYTTLSNGNRRWNLSINSNDWKNKTIQTATVNAGKYNGISDDARSIRVVWR